MKKETLELANKYNNNINKLSEEIKEIDCCIQQLSNNYCKSSLIIHREESVINSKVKDCFILSLEMKDSTPILHHKKVELNEKLKEYQTLFENL